MQTRSSTRGGRKVVLASVGTTRFDKLIEALDTKEVQDALWERGFSSLKIQRGKSEANPTKRSGMAVEVYAFKPSLAPDMQEAELIISHAGAGCIMESLRMGKRTIVVANDSLMDNHQMELADAMKAAGYVAVATPCSLAQVIASCADEGLTPLPPVSSELWMKEMATLRVDGIKWPTV